MGIPWRKVFGVFRKVVDVGGMLNPHLAALDALIEGVELSMGEASGADKKEAVIRASDAILANTLLKLRPEEIAAIQAARSKAIDAIVAAKNAHAAALEAVDALQDALREVKAA